MLSVHCLRPEWQAATLPLSVIVLVEGPFFFFPNPGLGAEAAECVRHLEVIGKSHGTEQFSKNNRTIYFSLYPVSICT